MSVNEVLAALSPTLRKRLFVASEAPEITYQATPSINLNTALNGGLPYGRQVLIWGNKSSGKSSLCLQMIGEAQKAGKVCAWIDAEMAFDQEWAQRLGVDCSQLIYSTARTVNEMTDTGVELMKAGVDVIVVDSISSLLPAVYFQKDSKELKDLDQTQQIGAFAKDMDHAVKMLNYANNQNNQTLLVLISQARNQINATYTQAKPQGGYAVEFYSSVVIKLFSSESEAQAIKGMITMGDRILEKKVGRKVTWQVVFSKTSANFRSGEYDFYFAGDKIGVDTVGELVDTAEDMGYLKRKGAWYTLPDESQVQGKVNMVKRLSEDKQLYDTILARINNE